MPLEIDVCLRYALPGPRDMILQIEAADLPDQHVSQSRLELSPDLKSEKVADNTGYRSRVLLHGSDRFECRYSATVDLSRPTCDLSTLAQFPLHALPGDVVRYLLPSRYCPTDEFQTLVEAEFGSLHGGARICAMRDWIARSFSYAPGASTAQTTALDSFVQRRGVCRDFAHVMITLARASTIPARFASVYAPDVQPPDFHATAEVYLENGWHLVDATGMAKAEDMALIGIGMDAAEVAFLSSFGDIEMIEQSVSVTRT